MKRSLFTDSTSVHEDTVFINYNGKPFEIPRSEYYKRLSVSYQTTRELRYRLFRFLQQEQQRSSKFAGEVARQTDSETTAVTTSDSASTAVTTSDSASTAVTTSDSASTAITTSTHSSNEEPGRHSKQNMNSASQRQPTVVSRPQVEQLFTAEDFVESRETFIYQPTVPGKSGQSAVKRSDESLASITTIPEVTGSLCQLKAHVTNLIDQTIRNIESSEQIAAAGQSGGAEMRDGGDCSGKSGYKVNQNLQVFRTDSVVKSKQEIRMKLYSEIEKLVCRLKDMECLE